MIDKLYKLRKSQRDLKILEKSRLLIQISDIEDKIDEIEHEINTVSVDRFGMINDFAVLQIHKNHLRNLEENLSNEKLELNDLVLDIEDEIKYLQQEKEKYSYLVDLQLQEKKQKMIKADEEFADEYMQSKYYKAQIC